MKIALAGPPQSGKTENQQTFQDEGWTFINLNTTGDRIRRLGSRYRRDFENLAPGEKILDDAGKRQVAYYRAMLRDPTILDRFARLELPHLLHTAQARISDSRDCVLSWESWELIAPRVKVDHIFFLSSRQDVWLTRLRQRASLRGHTGGQLQDHEIMRIMEASGFIPLRMLTNLRKVAGSTTITCIDTGDEDWGANNIRKVLRRLRRQSLHPQP